jgi:hypothetical protein
MIHPTHSGFSSFTLHGAVIGMYGLPDNFGPKCVLLVIGARKLDIFTIETQLNLTNMFTYDAAKKWHQS